MRLFLNLDTRSFIESAQFQRAVSSLVLKRRDRLPVDVQFMRNGSVVELQDGATGKLGLKADKDFNGTFAASDSQWTRSGTGDATAYRFDLNLNTVQINALFAGVPTPPFVPLMLEIEWAEGDLRTSSNTLAVTLENDIIRGDEGIVEEGGPVYPLPGELEQVARKGQISGYAGLDESGKVPVGQLPEEIELVARRGHGGGYASLNAFGEVPISQLPNAAARHMSASFNAEPGHTYSVNSDNFALLTPAVLPTVTLAGIVFTGLTPEQSTTINFNFSEWEPYPYFWADGESVYLNGPDTITQGELVVFAAANMGDYVTAALATPDTEGTPMGETYSSGQLSGGQSEVSGYTPVVATLPTSPVAGETMVSFADAQGIWGENPLVLNPGDNMVFGRAGNFSIRTPALLATAIFIDDVRGWTIFTGLSVPTNTATPSITGTAAEYYSLECSRGEWTNAPTEYRFRWQVSDDGETQWSDIQGATSAKFTVPKTTHTGQFLRCGVIATSAAGDSNEEFATLVDPVEETTFPAAQLLGFWKLDDLTDSSGKGNTLTKNNSATFVSGKLGNGAYVSDGWLSKSGISLSGSYSVSGWFKHLGENAYGGMFVTGAVGGPNNRNLGLYGGSDPTNQGRGPGFWLVVSWPTLEHYIDVEAGVWTHIAVVCEGTSTSVYVNGLLVSTIPSVPVNDSGILIGNTPEQQGGEGVVDALGIWSRALSVGEIGVLYNSGAGLEFDPIRPGLLGFWKLDDLTDASGNGHTLTNHNGVTFNTGKIGKAAVLDGDTNFLTCVGNFVMQADFAFSFWWKVGTVNLANNVWGHSAIGGCAINGTPVQTNLLFISTNGILNIGSDVVGPRLSFSDIPQPAGVWHHAVVQRRAGVVSGWIDGVKSANEMTYPDPWGDSGLLLGKIPAFFNVFAVSIDALGIWNRALDPYEIELLYNSGTGFEI